ncbi:hypothetical protein JOE44_004101 [Chryseobacterium sp. PvR013]|uniref:DUF4297 domain-containing protein n=1 Tax=Chryseobacterium sp. PvR013 TaxID=2806595 RepID=UPI001AE0F32E|nr:DUF4297 domain-containing protein [Chryseobacterium sp. PvR013]MBP1167217.1 hypothetical protein [Chryseobacterium sp. PvR013]
MPEKKNPLFEAQREKSGSKTISKYLFQYHWALYKIITEHSTIPEYAIFLELHEDVIICDSLDVNKAKFDFNQVKTTNVKFNTNQLVKSKKNGSSVLGKLVKSGSEKPFTKAINKINLIAVKDYGLELKKEGITLKTITKDDLSKKQLDELELELKKEIGVNGLPDNLQFIVTNLPETNYQLITIGAIAELINSLFPHSYTDAKNIYTTLIDELIRKGKETYDFTLWEEVLKNKALTSVQVVNVIAQFTNIKNESNIDIEFNDICKELNLKSVQSKQLRQQFNRYRTQKLSNRSTLQLDTTKNVIKLINENFSNGETDIKDLINNVSKSLPQNIKKQFTNEQEIASAIICEFIMMN